MSDTIGVNVAEVVPEIASAPVGSQPETAQDHELPTTVPYDRFREVNHKMRSLEKELGERKSQSERLAYLNQWDEYLKIHPEVAETINRSIQGQGGDAFNTDTDPQVLALNRNISMLEGKIKKLEESFGENSAAQEANRHADLLNKEMEYLKTRYPILKTDIAAKAVLALYGFSNDENSTLEDIAREYSKSHGESAKMVPTTYLKSKEVPAIQGAGGNGTPLPKTAELKLGSSELKEKAILYLKERLGT